MDNEFEIRRPRFDAMSRPHAPRPSESPAEATAATPAPAATNGRAETTVGRAQGGWEGRTAPRAGQAPAPDLKL